MFEFNCFESKNSIRIRSTNKECSSLMANMPFRLQSSHFLIFGLQNKCHYILLSIMFVHTSAFHSSFLLVSISSIHLAMQVQKSNRVTLLYIKTFYWLSQNIERPLVDSKCNALSPFGLDDKSAFSQNMLLRSEYLHFRLYV